MRETKFRALALQPSKWVYGLYFKSGSEGQWTEMQMETGATVYVDEETIGQYSGLKDKTGREVYEGDVYGYTMTIDGSHWNEHQVQGSDVVKFEDGAFYHGEHLMSDVIEYDNTLTYLGNIHENPELLEVVV